MFEEDKLREQYYRGLTGQAGMFHPQGLQQFGAWQQVGRIQSYNALQRSYNKTMTRKMDDIMCLGNDQYVYDPSKEIKEPKVEQKVFKLKEEVKVIKEIVKQI